MTDNNFEKKNSNNTSESKEKESKSGSNSVFLKSIDDNNFDFIDILNKKNDLSISFNNSEETIQIKIEGIKKIFSLISDNNNNNIESLYSQYITAIVPEGLENLSDINNDNDNEFDLTFMKLIDQAKFYTISLNNNTNLYNNILVSSKSINKIFNLLQINIYNIYEYINIVILKLNNDISSNKIINKNSLSNENTFRGIKYFDINLKKVNKIEKVKFDNIEYLFSNVLDQIEMTIGRSFEPKNSKKLKEIDSENDFENLDFNIPRTNYKEGNNINQNEKNDSGKDNNISKCLCAKDICTECNLF